MKRRNILAAALIAVIAVCSCGKKTVISGTLPLDYQYIDTLQVYLDTTLVATSVVSPDGAYKLKVPVDITRLAGVGASPYFVIPFISDGALLTLSFPTGEDPCLEAAKGGEIGLSGRMKIYQDAVMEIQTEMMTVLSEYQDKDIPEEKLMEMMDTLLAPQADRLKALNLKTLKENPDNILSLMALSNLEVDAEVMALVKDLSPEMKKREEIKMLLAQIEAAQSTAIGARFLDFEGALDCNNLDGSKVHLSDYVGQGKYILLDFWASWCGPCKMEVPYIQAAYQKYYGSDFDVVSVAVGDNPDDSAIAAVDLKIIWNSIIGAGERPAELYGVTAIPHLILFGPDGTILERGFRGEDIEKVIAKYIQ